VGTREKPDRSSTHREGACFAQPCISDPCAIDCVADIGVGRNIESLLVGGFESAGEGFGLGALDEVDGAAAEAATSETCTEAAGQRGCCLDEEIDLFAAALKVVAVR